MTKSGRKTWHNVQRLRETKRRAPKTQNAPNRLTGLVKKLYEHCAEINEAAQRRIDLIMPELVGSAGATEDLKRKDQLAWVGLMNACRAQADEIVKFELVYD